MYWLHNLLTKSTKTPLEVHDEALAIGITEEELKEAKLKLQVVEVMTNGHKFLQLPKVHGFQPGFDPRRHVPSKPDAQTSSGSTMTATGSIKASPGSTSTAPRTKRTPDEAVDVAKRRLKRHSVRHVRFLEELAERASQDAAPCPTCKRGMPRQEEIRLRAVTEALNKAGIVAPKEQGDGWQGPVLVFPEGSRMAIGVETPRAPVILRRGSDET